MPLHQQANTFAKHCIRNYIRWSQKNYDEFLRQPEQFKNADHWPWSVDSLTSYLHKDYASILSEEVPKWLVEAYRRIPEVQKVVNEWRSTGDLLLESLKAGVVAALTNRVLELELKFIESMKLNTFPVVVVDDPPIPAGCRTDRVTLERVTVTVPVESHEAFESALPKRWRQVSRVPVPTHQLRYVLEKEVPHG